MLPVAPLIQPISVGLTKPPRMPSELITAMPAAAALRPRYVGGIDQKSEPPPKMKNDATHSSVITMLTPEPANDVDASAITPMASVPPTCQRRSPKRSELRLIMSTPSAPKKYGTAVNQPIVDRLAMPMPLIIVGSQKVSV